MDTTATNTYKSPDVVSKVLADKGVTEYRLAKIVGVTQPALWMTLHRTKGLISENLARMLDALDYELVARPKEGTGTEYVVTTERDMPAQD